MPVPLGYSRSTFYGTMPGGDVWNFSLWANEAPSDQPATQAQATAFATEFQVAATTGQTQPWSLWSADTVAIGCKVYSYTDATGHAKYIADAPINKTGLALSSALLPNQCALVVTLRSAVAGRRSTGRIYVPVTQVTMQAGGQVASTSASGLANWMSAFITRLNSHIGASHIGILSQKGGTFASANAVVVDSKVDIQRRRANKVASIAKYTVAIL